MNWRPFIVAYPLLLLTGMPASAHRLDEYLQATLISLDDDRVEVQMRMTPGVSVSPFLLLSIDTDADADISVSESHAYAERVLKDLSLRVDGARLALQLLSMEFPPVPEMQEGLGEISIQFSALLPRGGAVRKLVFENHHQPQIAAYLVNVLVPDDRHIRVVAQQRNEQQSIYQLEYMQASVAEEVAAF